MDERLSVRLDAVNDSLSSRIDVTNQRLGVIEETLAGTNTQVVLIGRYLKTMDRRH